MTTVSPTRNSLAVESKPKKRLPKKLRTMEHADAYLLDRTNLERVKPRQIAKDAFKLDRMHALLEALDHPHRGFQAVHIAGSKGKGSVCEMLASALGSCGYAVGVYSSPHLVRVNERIRVGSREISETDFVAMANQCREAATCVEKVHGKASYFEIMTAMAFCYFVHQAVDVAVIEVGLGGRLDCTNVITPEVCGLASIQLEHTDLLGTTLAEIAAEKAGIMKPGVPFVTIQQDESVMEVLKEKADAIGAPLLVLGEDTEYSCRFESEPDLGPHARICVTSPRISYEHIAVPLKGEHQAANCGLALAILDQLADRGFVAPEHEVAVGLSNTSRSGRLELACASPRILLDTAHTPDSIACLVKAVGAHLRFDSVVTIFGCASDKDVDRMLVEIARGADKVIFTRVTDNPRAMDPAELARRFREHTGTMCQVEPDLKTAINTASRAVGHEDLILVTGSAYLVGEAKRLFEAKAAREQQNRTGSS